MQSFFSSIPLQEPFFNLITALISRPEKISLSEENKVSHLCVDKETAGQGALL